MKSLKYTLMAGDCIERLRELPDNSVDSVVTDPPYGLSKEPDIAEVLTKWIAGEPYDHKHGGFMGKAWDSFVPHPDIWREVYRVLKPGGHALVFSGTRTQDLMTVALRLSGFEVRDVIEWLYFSGFPKSMNVGKAIEAKQLTGSSRPEDLRRVRMGDAYTPSGRGRINYDVPGGNTLDTSAKDAAREVQTELARKWDGWGTALKPAHEPIIVVRKPLIDPDTGRKLTVTDCVEKYGTGAINIDASRIYTDETVSGSGGSRKNQLTGDERTEVAAGMFAEGSGAGYSQNEAGRFPANCATTDDDAFYSKYFNVAPAELSKKAAKKDRNSDWLGVELDGEAKQVRRLSGGEYKHNSGSTSSSKNGAKAVNNHPTVKPTDLMAWLVRLVTPPGGTTLDPFAGSGSTLVAARREGFGFIGIEREQDYVKIIEARAGVNAV